MEACFVNIGPAGRRQRLRFGQVAIGLALLGAIAMIVTDLDRMWRLALFVPFLLGGVGVFQARAGT